LACCEYVVEEKCVDHFSSHIYTHTHTRKKAELRGQVWYSPKSFLDQIQKMQICYAAQILIGHF
jgi:hypothetical protein